MNHNVSNFYDKFLSHITHDTADIKAMMRDIAKDVIESTPAQYSTEGHSENALEPSEPPLMEEEQRMGDMSACKYQLL